MQKHVKFSIILTGIIALGLITGWTANAAAQGTQINIISLNMLEIAAQKLNLTKNLTFTSGDMTSCTLKTNANGETICGSDNTAVVPGSKQCTGTDKVTNVTLNATGDLNITCGTDQTGGGGGASFNITNKTKVMTVSPNAVNFTYGLIVTNTTGNVATIQVGDLSLPAGNITGVFASASIGSHTHAAENITSGTIDDARISTNLTSWKSGITSLTWSNLTGYPTACAAGEYISAFGDTLTCANIALVGSQITAGTVLSNFIGSHIHPAENITTGTLEDARLSANITSWKTGVTIPLTNTTGSSSTQCSGTDKRAYNITLTNGVLAIVCGEDALGAGGDSSIGNGLLYNTTNNMYFNTTAFNTSYDLRYFTVAAGIGSLNSDNITTALVAADIGSHVHDAANITTGLLPAARIGSIIVPTTNLSGGLTFSAANITSGLLASTYMGSHTLPTSNLTGGITISGANITSGIVVSTYLGSHTHDAANVTTGNLNLSTTGQYTVTNSTGTFWYVGGALKGYMIYNGTGILINATG